MEGGAGAAIAVSPERTTRVMGIAGDAGREGIQRPPQDITRKRGRGEFVRGALCARSGARAHDATTRLFQLGPGLVISPFP